MKNNSITNKLQLLINKTKITFNENELQEIQNELSNIYRTLKIIDFNHDEPIFEMTKNFTNYLTEYKKDHVESISELDHQQLLKNTNKEIRDHYVLLNDTKEVSND